jgi:plastocyanin
LLSIWLLVAALGSFPPAASASWNDAAAAMVEGSSLDIDTWAFAARVPIGGTLRWTNLGSQTHTVTATDGTFDTGSVAPGSIASLEFNVPGLFWYACVLHPTMKGAVYVSLDDSSPSPSIAMVESDPADEKTWAFALSIQAGQSVAWANVGTQGHTATTTDFVLDTGLVDPGATGAIEFDTPGVFAYLCTPHPWMRGTVVVNTVATEQLPLPP